MTDVAPAMSGTQKAALVLMQLDREHAAAVLQQMTEAEAEELMAEVVRLRGVDPTIARSALDELVARASVPPPPPQLGGKDFATELLSITYGADKAADLIDRVDAAMGIGAFDFLRDVPAERIHELIADEMTETIAFVLARLDPPVASAVLVMLDSGQRVGVARAIAVMGHATTEATGAVASTLRSRLRGGGPAIAEPVEAAAGSDALAPGGAVPLAAMMGLVDPAVEREIMADLRELDASLAAQIGELLLTFDDLPRLLDRDVQQVLRGIDIRELALALKGASEDIQAVIRNNLSERNREALTTEGVELGRVPRSAVEEARNTVVRSLRAYSASNDGLELKGGDESADAAAEAAPVEDEEEYVD